MFIAIERELLHTQDYDSALRQACDELSAQGVKNYIHYTSPRMVEFFDSGKFMRVLVDFSLPGIEFYE